MRAGILQVTLKHSLIPLAVLTLYFAALSLVLSVIVPEYADNVNAAFAGKSWRFFLLLTVVFSLVFLFGFRLAGDKKTPLPTERGRFRAADLLLVLLPLSPVVEYVINNQDILTPRGSLYVLIVFFVFSGLFAIVIPVLLGRFASLRTLMLLGTAFAFMVTGMASLSASFNWLEAGNFRIQLLIFGGIFIVGRILYGSAVGRKFARCFVAGFFIVNSLAGLTSRGSESTLPESPPEENRLAELVGSCRPLSTPNIYLLIYDAYVVNETMLGYGIDNRAQEEFLESSGFIIYPHTYSIGAHSISTMSRVFNASVDYYGTHRKAASGNGVVHNLLRNFGYETYGLFASDYFFRGIGSSYDFSFPGVKNSHTLLTKAIFMGEFRFDVEFDQPSDEEFVGRKLSVLGDSPPGPRLVYIHTPIPNHSQNSGACLPDETDLFRDRLEEANHQMNRDLETLLSNDPEAIIIVAGDHGPYLTKNCYETGGHYDISEITRLDIQDRFGTFLAIRWPDGDFSGYDDITVLQDIFPAISAYLFNDRKFLEARIEPHTRNGIVISNAAVRDGIIIGGINDGEPLFLTPGDYYAR